MALKADSWASVLAVQRGLAFFGHQGFGGFDGTTSRYTNWPKSASIDGLSLVYAHSRAPQVLNK